MKATPLLFLVFGLLSMALLPSANGQMDRFQVGPRGWGIKLKPELAVIGGLSYPFGRYAQLSDLEGEKGAAGQGYFGELRLTQRNSTRPLWNLQFSAGYMQHRFQKMEVLKAFDLAAISAKPWDMLYFMPGAGFRGGTRLKFDIHIAAGVLLYNGWNVRRGVYGKNQVLEVYEWRFKRSLGGVVRVGGSLGYRINKHWTVFADAAAFFGRGKREGQRLSETFRVDPVQQVAIEPPLSSLEETVLSASVFSMLNVGLGVRYVLYKHLHDPNQRYWNYY